MHTLEPAPTHRLRTPRPQAPRITALPFCVCVCTVVAGLGPRLALAAPADEPAAEEPSQSSAELMFRRGQAKYETADYNGAIELWTEAYALVDPTPENASIKALLMYNLGQAHIKAFEIDRDRVHLKQAEQLLQSFRANLELLYDDRALLDEELAKADARLAEVDAMLAELDASEAQANEPPPPVVEPAPEPEPIDGDERPGKTLIIAGGAVVGLGVLSGVTAIIGGALASGANDISGLDPSDLDGRAQQFGTGRAGNVMLIAGAIGAGVLIPTGAALVGVGAKRNKQHQQRAAALGRVRPSLGGVWGGAWGHGGGVTISGRF